MDANELEQAVNNIETDIWNSSGEIDYFNISLLTNGFHQRVSFCGIQLWNSEEDDRIPIDDSDTLEPIEEHLRRLLREELAKLTRIKI